MAAISDYLDGEVASEVRLQLESHLAHCTTCQVVYDSARKTVKILTDSGSFDLAADAADSITETIMNRIRSQGKNP
jgi:predicted anti-sigma-YlaC factor YlaD